MTKLKISGLMESSKPIKAKSIEPADNGTYEHIGSQGGTEMMYQGLKERVDPELLNQFNIICSRVRNLSEDKPNLLWLHDTWDDPESKHLQKKENQDKFSKLIFVSHFQQATYQIGLGVPYSKGIVLQNAIVPIEQHEKPKDQINLIYHTTPHRGLEILIPVAQHLAKVGVNFHLDVYSSFNAYGWGQRDEPYESTFEKIRNHPQMTYHGFQPNSVVREALKKAHIYAYPNIWPETSAISVIEAMSAGCNIICPNYAALPETCANFAIMYGANENHQQHANVFANLLNMTIRDYWDENNQNRLKFQKMYTDNFYNWDVRASQWSGFLQSLLQKS